MSANINVSRLLMPLAFASSMGGMMTLIGTPPNLVIQNALIEAGYERLSFFTFTPVGLSLIHIFLFSIFSGFRYYVGVDYVNYVKIYNLEEGYGSRELGFNLILDFLRYIGASYQFMFFIMAVVMQILVYNLSLIHI